MRASTTWVITVTRIALVAHHQTAIDLDRLPGHVVGVGPRQEGDDAGDVLGSLRSSKRDAGRALLPRLARRPAVQGGQLAVDLRPHRRVDGARADAVGGDAIGRECLRRERVRLITPAFVAEYGVIR